MTGIIDYGVGNLFSLRSSCACIGQEAFVSGDASELAKADRLILPGVGAFEDAAKKLRDSGMAEFVRAQAAAGKPLLGICLGMQLLFEKSYEYGCHQGLGLLKGQVVPMEGKLPAKLKIPHMGWNKLELRSPSPLLKEAEGQYVYFVHSFHCVPEDKSLVTAVCDYGMEVTASVGRGNVQAFQFHPEKSSRVGAGLLRAFKEWQP